MISSFFCKLPNPSEQQKEVIESCKIFNVSVKSVAGSGKSTCCAHIIQSQPKMKFLVLTYSSNLKVDMRKLIQKINLNNVEVHSFHSSGKFFLESCINDRDLIKIINNDYLPNKILDFDYIVIDEVQDMTENLYLYTKYLLNQIKKDYKIILFGDPRQCIYEYMGSNEKYLLNPEKYFKNNYNWIRKNLSFSFRATKNITKVLNYGFLNANVLQSLRKNDHKTFFYEYDPWEKTKANLVYKKVIEELHNGYKPSDIFILSYSLKSGKKNKSPIAIIENILTSNNIPVCTIKSCSEINNKIILSTFHGTKGLERKLVFIIGVDDSLIGITGQNYETCPNIIYVALTRAKDKLFLFKSKNKNQLPFLNQEKLKEYCETNWEINYERTEYKNKKKDYFVTDIVKKEIIFENLKYEIVKIASDNIILPNYDNTNQINISNINGIVIPLWIEQKLKGKIKYLELISLYERILDGRDTLLEKDENTKKEINKFYQNPSSLRKIIKELGDSLENKKVSSIEELINLSIFIDEIKTGYSFINKNLSKRDWLTMNNLKNSFFNILHLNLKKSGTFEYSVSKSFYISDEKEICINGVIDYIDDEKVIEFKCKKELIRENIIQLYFYMFLLGEPNKIYLLVNILSSETIKINYDYELARSIVFSYF